MRAEGQPFSETASQVPLGITHEECSSELGGFGREVRAANEMALLLLSHIFLQLHDQCFYFSSCSPLGDGCMKIH